MSDRHGDPKAHFFGATHVGQIRSSNQENYLISDMRRLLKVCDNSVGGLDGQSVVSIHPGNMLWNCISADKTPPEPEVRRERLRAGDRVVLCSDGLTKHLSIADIASVLASTESAESQTKQLIEESNRRGGRDNISVVIGAFEGPPDAELLCDDPGYFELIELLNDTDVEFSISP